MPLQDISNPLLSRPEMITSGVTQLDHGGSRVSLGAGQRVAFTIISPVNFIFRETRTGRATRGSNPISRFYVVKQNVTDTKIFSFTNGAWSLTKNSGSENDDPVDNVEVAVNSQERPVALVSFFDAPGFAAPPQMTQGVDRRATRVCLVQNFEVWVQVAPRFSRGAFQASPSRLWCNLLCVRRSDPDAAVWTVDSGNLLSGQMRTTRPLCD
jgi:hypothetical protein